MKKSWLPLFFCLPFFGALAQSQEKEMAAQSFPAKDTAMYWLLTGKNNAVASINNRPGIEVVRQLSMNQFIVKGKPGSVPDGLWERVSPAGNNWKLSPRLLKLETILKEDLSHQFYIVTDSINQLKDQFRKMQQDVRVVRAYGKILLVETSDTLINKFFLPNDAVQYIDIADQKAVEESSISGFDYSLNHINILHHVFPNNNGRHLIGSVKENRPDTADIDFKGRYIATNAAATTLSAHATTMSTIIAGAGNSFYTGRGVAPAANISSASFDVLLPNSDSYYRQYNISVQNHSYGTGIENFYGADAAAYDESVIANPALVHVFSGGNAGDQASGTGAYQGLGGFANITGSFKMAKNIITVGSSDSFAAVPVLSSKGPAHDGRLKPELIAYSEDGSSGAAALVSGTVMVLQDIYKQQHADSLPDAALIKAFLLNSAADAGPTGIDFSAGYGNLDAFRAANELNSSHFFTGSITQGAIAPFHLQLPANAKDFKIMLCWTDPTARPNAFTALVNDLDLTVTSSPDSHQWLPWVLNSYPHSDSLRLPPQRRKDSLNTQEQVTIEAPPAGEYTITVKGTSLKTTEQKFFVVYQWDTARTFRWNFPTADDNLLPGKLQVLRWTNNNSSNGLLEYSIAGSNNWTMLNNQVAGGSRLLQWRTPDTSAVAILRMTINGRQYLSDSFTISAPLKPGVGYNCATETLLYWNNIPTATYEVYKLGERYMEPFQHTADSSVIINKTYPVTWFSVAPVLAFNKQGVRSMAFDYTTQGAGCYINNLTADLIKSSGQLELTLGSLYLVEHISIEKMGSNGVFQLWRQAPPPVSFKYHFTDSMLTRGANVYRARIDLQNGKVLYGDIQTIYFTGRDNYILYPNPVAKAMPVTILATQPGIAVLEFFTVYGQKLAEKRLANLTEQLSTVLLVKGVYFYVIRENGKKVSSGKLIVQ